MPANFSASFFVFITTYNSVVLAVMISVIIPTYNEEAAIAGTIHYLKDNSGIAIKEIIVADGGSLDNTIYSARQAGATVITCTTKGRAAQMNAGAAMATGDILYFLHADTLPPKDFAIQVTQAHKAGYLMGCYRLQFDYHHWFLKANSWFTRFDVNAFRFGDQSLFADKKIFTLSGGFNEKLIMLEDQEIITRLRKHGEFIVTPATVITSSRKYIRNGIYKTQAVYFIIYFLYRLGFSQQRLLRLYRKLIVQDKL